MARLRRLRDCIRTALSWRSIVEDVEAMRLVLDNLRFVRLKKSCKERRMCYRVSHGSATNCCSVLCRIILQQQSQRWRFILSIPVGQLLGLSFARVCTDNVLVITTWSPIHLRDELKKLYWKTDKPAFSAIAFWKTLCAIFICRDLKNRGVLEQAIIKGAGSRDFFGTAYGRHDEKIRWIQIRRC